MADTVPFDASLFAAAAVDAETAAFNDAVVGLMTPLPDWWVVSAEATREARRTGSGAFPAPVYSPRAANRLVPTPDGRRVKVRVIAPQSPKGVYLHIHGGGWTLGSCDSHDPMLERTADTAGLAVVSVEYRLAPEHPYPAGPDDCEAVALWLAQHAKAEFGTDKLTIGGESGGGHLSAVTLLRMRDKHGFSGFCGANLVYGAYDLNMTPSVRAYGDARRLVLRTIDYVQFRQAFLPGRSNFDDPDISPMFGDLAGLCPALFSVGTADALIDDSLFMHARWVAAGNRGELAIWPGGAHGFTLFPCAVGTRACARADAFLAACVA